VPLCISFWFRCFASLLCSCVFWRWIDIPSLHLLVAFWHFSTSLLSNHTLSCVIKRFFKSISPIYPADEVVHISFGLSVPEALSLLPSPAPQTPRFPFCSAARALPAFPWLARLAASPRPALQSRLQLGCFVVVLSWPDILGIIALFRLSTHTFHSLTGPLGCIFGPGRGCRWGKSLYWMSADW